MGRIRNDGGWDRRYKDEPESDGCLKRIVKTLFKTLFRVIWWLIIIGAIVLIAIQFL